MRARCGRLLGPDDAGAGRAAEVGRRMPQEPRGAPLTDLCVSRWGGVQLDVGELEGMAQQPAPVDDIDWGESCACAVWPHPTRHLRRARC